MPHLPSLNTGFNMGQHFSSFSRDSSPSRSGVKFDVISSTKPIEEETNPRYNAHAFYPAKYGEVLNGRYEIVAKLGYGVTATVWLAKDLNASPVKEDRKFVAIKISVNTISDKFVGSRRKIAERLQTTDPDHPGYKHIRFFLQVFETKGPHGRHLCVVYDVLREPIGVCMKKFEKGLFDGNKLRILLPALLLGLDYMHTCGVVHTDLKPDNILMGIGEPAVLNRFVEKQRSHPPPRKSPDNHGRVIYQSCDDFGDIPTDKVIATSKIVDIGLADWGNEHHDYAIQSNAFTAPEVILTAGWTYPTDIWNLGVMLFDLFEYSGLFDSMPTQPGLYHSDKHLALMISLLGPPPKALLERGATSATYFDENGQFRQPKLVKHDTSFEGAVVHMRGYEKDVFIDFIKKMLTWLPEDRWTAKQLLDHPFLHMEPTGASANSNTSRSPSAAPSSHANHLGELHLGDMSLNTPFDEHPPSVERTSTTDGSVAGSAVGPGSLTRTTTSMSGEILSVTRTNTIDKRDDPNISSQQLIDSILKRR